MFGSAFLLTFLCFLLVSFQSSCYGIADLTSLHYDEHTFEKLSSKFSRESLPSFIMKNFYERKLNDDLEYVFLKSDFRPALSKIRHSHRIGRNKKIFVFSFKSEFRFADEEEYLPEFISAMLYLPYNETVVNFPNVRAYYIRKEFGHVKQIGMSKINWNDGKDWFPVLLEPFQDFAEDVMNESPLDFLLKFQGRTDRSLSGGLFPVYLVLGFRPFHVTTPTEITNPLLWPAVDVGDRPGQRARRAADDDTICSRERLYVDFRELQWDSWIIAPEGYMAYQCRGECNFPLSSHQNSTNHAIIQSLGNSLYSSKVPKVCCVPTRLESQSLLYYDPEGNVVLKPYQNMIVTRCGCR